MYQENYYRTWQISQKTEKGKQHEIKKYKGNKVEREGYSTRKLLKKYLTRVSLERLLTLKPGMKRS